MKNPVLVILLLGPFFAARGQNIVNLKPDHIDYQPKNFFVADVTDDRDEKSIGTMKSGGKSDNLDFQNGAASALKSYIDGSLTQKKNTQAISVHISRISFSMRKVGATWQESGEAVLTLYAADKNLVEYSSKATKTTDGDPLDFVNEFVKKTLESDLKRFDSWWAQNGGKIPTASIVKVNAVMGRTPRKPDQIVYSLDRPLQISDFHGPPENDRQEMAATLSGAGLETTGDVQSGQLELMVTITPYFDISGSWFKQDERSQIVLAHEQAHFDITAIKACELVQKIRNTTFTQENYEPKLHELMQWNNEETDKEQAEYDSETNHGTIKDKQLEWQKKIAEQVRQIGCY